jgi:hypothetical protein
VELVRAAAVIFHRLFDDASIFPPGNLAMPYALAHHHEVSNAWYADLVGPFVCSELRWPELVGYLSPGSLGVSLVVTAGLPAVGVAVSAALAEPLVALRSVEVPIDPDELPQAVGTLNGLPDDVQAYVEVPLGTSLLALHNTRHHAKFRTTGDNLALAEAMVEAARWRVPFKLTAGLHHAVAGHEGSAHGFLNTLLGAALALDGAPVDVVAAQLAESSADAVAKHIDVLSADDVGRIRRLLTSIGTCSISEPLADLLALGLLR